MLQELQKLTVPIVIAVSFFLFGFVMTAGMLDLTDREILTGLIAGLFAGITTLVTVLHQATTNPEARLPQATSGPTS